MEITARERVLEKGQDYGVAVLKGALGAVPLFGSLMAELLGTTIPNRRMDRVERVLASLAERVRDMAEQDVREKTSEPGFLNLMEEGLYAAARATVEAR